MYYRLYCLQNHRVMATGFNVTSKKELKEDMLHYAETDLDEADNWESAKAMGCDELAEFLEFEIQESNEPFIEEETNSNGGFLWAQ